MSVPEGRYVTNQIVDVIFAHSFQERDPAPPGTNRLAPSLDWYTDRIVTGLDQTFRGAVPSYYAKTATNTVRMTWTDAKDQDVATASPPEDLPGYHDGNIGEGESIQLNLSYLVTPPRTPPASLW